MFEEGIRLRQERGAENVFDFTLGNPEVEPPEAVIAALRRVVEENRPRSHGYMPNAGFPAVRQAMARRLAERTGLGFTGDDVLMTVGAAGAINTLLKSILDPGDETIVLNPYFPNRFYIENHGGAWCRWRPTSAFQPDVGRIARAITPRTRAIILNSPNNPTGAIYPEAVLRELNEIVRRSGDRDLRRALPAARVRRHRAAGDAAPDRAERAGVVVVEGHGGGGRAHRVPGAVAAAARTRRPARRLHLRQSHAGLHQRARHLAVGGGRSARRDGGCGAVPGQARPSVRRATGMGYDAPRPQGSFYCFPRTPIADDVAFIRRLQKEGILAVPGSGFGRAGFMRLSLTIRREELERSLPGFERALAG